MSNHTPETTRASILRLLRRAPRSVNELAEALGVTDNAVRASLARLERDQLILQTGTRPSVRKPEAIYDLTPAGEHFFSKASAPVLESLLEVIESNLSEAEVEAKLRDVGRRLAAPHLQAVNDCSPEQRAGKALQVLAALGGLAEMQQRDGREFIVGFGCPFSELVALHPKLCLIAEAALAELLGRPVHEQCQRGVRSKCCFVIEEER